MIAEARTLLRLSTRSLILQAVVLLCSLLVIANVAGAAASVGADFAQFRHTRAEYSLNHLDFDADLHGAPAVTERGRQQVVGNLARFDYDTLAAAVESLSPQSSVAETLKYFGFLVYPALFFLLGLWLATAHRRERLEKVALARAGALRTIAARQAALAVIATVTISATVLVDLLSRTIARDLIGRFVPIADFAGATALVHLPAPAADPVAQWAVVILATTFFGAAGVAVGTLAGVFAVPAVGFLGWDFVVPILGANDPRNWFEVLGHAVFRYSAQFELADPLPLPVSVAAGACALSAVAFLALGYVGVIIRNPRAT